MVRTPPGSRRRGEAPAQGLRNRACPSETQNANGEISQRRHNAWAVALTDLATVLVEGHVPHPVKRVLNPPVASHKGEDLRCCLFAGSHEARDTIYALLAQLRTIELCYIAVDPKCCADMGESQIAAKIIADGDLAYLDAAMTLVKRFRLRGKNRPDVEL